MASIITGATCCASRTDLETQIVFPAAAYVALPIEAISQITGVKDKLLERVA